MSNEYQNKKRIIFIEYQSADFVKYKQYMENGDRIIELKILLIWYKIELQNQILDFFWISEYIKNIILKLIKYKTRTIKKKNNKKKLLLIRYKS